MTASTSIAHPVVDHDASAALADFVAAVPGGSIPKCTLDCVEQCLLDFVGNTAFAARFAESSAAFCEGALQLEPARGPITVVGEPVIWSQAQAALLNGAFAHSMDFDDTNANSVLHPGAPVIPLPLSCAETGDASGRELLEAITVGYEVVCRTGAALGQSAYDRGFHATGVAGIFGAVAAAGRLQKLDTKTINTAFVIVGSLAGTVCFRLKACSRPSCGHYPRVVRSAQERDGAKGVCDVRRRSRWQYAARVRQTGES